MIDQLSIDVTSTYRYLAQAVDRPELAAIINSLAEHLLQMYKFLIKILSPLKTIMNYYCLPYHLVC